MTKNKKSVINSRSIIEFKYGTTRVPTSEIPGLITQALLAEKIKQPVTVTGVFKNYRKRSKKLKASDSDVAFTHKDVSVIDGVLKKAELHPMVFPMNEDDWFLYENVFDDFYALYGWEVMPSYSNPRVEYDVLWPYVEAPHKEHLKRAINSGRLVQRDPLTCIPTLNEPAGAYVRVEDLRAYVLEFDIEVIVNETRVTVIANDDAFLESIIGLVAEQMRKDRKNGTPEISQRSYAAWVAGELERKKIKGKKGGYVKQATILREYLGKHWNEVLKRAGP